MPPKIPRISKTELLKLADRRSYTGIVLSKFLGTAYLDFYVNGEWHSANEGGCVTFLVTSKNDSPHRNTWFWGVVYKYYSSLGNHRLANEAASYILGKDE
jgi:hypothetical protein